jgi:hypothetical protein
MLNAKSRTALKDVRQLVTFVVTDAQNTVRVGGDNPV